MSNYDYNLLNETVSGEDLFEDKTHDKIAQSISDLIIRENKGITIGLEGSWGSGKSSVISMIFKKIKESKTKICTFQFDAWAHEGDRLRKIFLESFITELIKQIDKDAKNDIVSKLESKRKRINNQIITKTIKRKRSITKKGIVFSLAALLVPFGAAVLSNIDLSIVSFSGNFYPQFCIGLITVFAPFCVALFNILYLIVKRTPCKELFTPKNWLFLQNDDSEIEEKEFSEFDERTSVEFEKYFFEVLDAIFELTDFKKIVLVIDNLDRIEKANALNIWSTLQIFLQERNESNSSRANFNKVWILVPYDSYGLKKIWNDSNEISKSFIDKSFQLRVDVPKPIFSGWKKFAKIQIEKAVSTWDLKDKDILIDILLLTRKTITDVPTPREIKNYINQTAYLASLWGDKIALSSIAYYVIWRELENKSPDEIREQLKNNDLMAYEENPKVLTLIHKRNLSANVMEELSGLVFGVTPNKGYELLLLPEIQDTLENNKVERLEELVRKNEEGFWTIFDRNIVSSSLAPDILLKYSFSIEKAFDKSNPRLKKFIYLLKQKNIIPLAKDCFFEGKEFNFYQSYLNLTQRDDFVIESLKHFEATFNKYLLEGEGSFREDWLNTVVYNCEELIDDAKTRLSDFGVLCISFTFNQFLQWANYLYKEKKEYLCKYFTIRKDFFNELNSNVKELSVSEDIYYSLLYIVTYHFDSFKWDGVVKTLMDYLSKYSRTDNFYVLNILRLILSSTSDCNLNKECSILQDPLFNAFYYSSAEKSFVDIGIISGLLLGENLQSHNSSNFYYAAGGLQSVKEIWERDDLEFVELFCTELEKARNLNFVWKLIQDERNVLAFHIINYAAENKCLETLFESNENEIVASLKYLKKILTSDQVVSIVQIVIEKNEKIHKAISSIEILNSSEEFIVYVKAMYKLSKTIDNDLLKNIKHIQKDDWVSLIEENDELLDVLILMHEKQSLVIALHLSEALNVYSEESIHIEKTENEIDSDKWKSLLSLIPRQKKYIYIREVNNFFKNSLNDVNLFFIELNKDFIKWGEFFYSYKIIIETLLTWSCDGKEELVSFFNEDIVGSIVVPMEIDEKEKRSIQDFIDNNGEKKEFIEGILAKLSIKHLFLGDLVELEV